MSFYFESYILISGPTVQIQKIYDDCQRGKEEFYIFESLAPVPISCENEMVWKKENWGTLWDGHLFQVINMCIKRHSDKKRSTIEFYATSNNSNPAIECESFLSKNQKFNIDAYCIGEDCSMSYLEGREFQFLGFYGREFIISFDFCDKPAGKKLDQYFGVNETIKDRYETLIGEFSIEKKYSADSVQNLIDAIEEEGDANVIFFVDHLYRSNKEVILAAVSRIGLMLEYAEGGLKADRDIVLAAINNDRSAKCYADKSLLVNDPEIRVLVEEVAEEVAEEQGSVTVVINGYNYLIGCGIGEEGHVRRLGEEVETVMRSLVGSVGQIGEDELLLRVGLILAESVTTQSTKYLQSLGQTQSEITLTINGRNYKIGCHAEDVALVKMLGDEVENVIQSLVASVGQIGEAYLLSMLALVLVDRVSNNEKPS